MKKLTVYEVAQYITHIPGYSLLEIIIMCFIPTACDDGAILLYKDGILSNTLSEGTVLVCYNNTYGTVCDDRWDSLDATVICKWLGFEGANGEAHTISDCPCIL